MFKFSLKDALQSSKKPKSRTELNLIAKTFRLENPKLHKKTLSEINLHKVADIIVSRIFRQDRSFVGRNDAVLLQYQGEKHAFNRGLFALIL
ncbi:TrkA C-terminal domain-containing protein [Natranaerobius trueperi]|uniref:Uncharacterized protein n=1 Tax=Natranaerobius trueperi TaxID=759412 RepID=A0A226BYC3_9FIRM|nr:TrkA C-terminal domain-containing protein [Natranaerobius trueperi]OWZ83199.1 hypothetical protein CDO51_09880 [Natranaerobius trueperi]